MTKELLGIKVEDNEFEELIEREFQFWQSLDAVHLIFDLNYFFTNADVRDCFVNYVVAGKMPAEDAYKVLTRASKVIPDIMFTRMKFDIYTGLVEKGKTPNETILEQLVKELMAQFKVEEESCWLDEYGIMLMALGKSAEKELTDFLAAPRTDPAKLPKNMLYPTQINYDAAAKLLREMRT